MIIEKRGITDEGFEYIVGVHETLGHRLGYVGVPPESALYELEYNGEEGEVDMLNDIDHLIHVHGGLTFSGTLSENIIGGMNPYYFGFDCAHLGDGKISVNEMTNIISKHYSNASASELAIKSSSYSAIFSMFSSFDEGEPKSFEYTYYQCLKLSKQLKELEKNYESK